MPCYGNTAGCLQVFTAVVIHIYIKTKWNLHFGKSNAVKVAIEIPVHPMQIGNYYNLGRNGSVLS